MKKNVTLATLCILSASLIGAGSTAARGRAFPKPVRTYEELKQETGLSTPDGLVWGRMAVDVGGKDWPVTVSFRCHADGGHVESGLTPPPATKIFDNLYYVGDADTSAWAVNTPDGIILIDALTTEADAQKFIVNGLKSVGLDPAKIRYILVSHEHGDHYGGAPMLQKLSGARVGLSEVGWKAVEQMGPNSPLAQSPRPARDLVLEDGEAVSLGGTTIRIVATPGHTPGPCPSSCRCPRKGSSIWRPFGAAMAFQGTPLTAPPS
ncbi:MBL fold metallo-hydrolase [Sphingobium sp.]|uniref:MBL fold metallo-hydrolase n=1 Tax=Sphingobium sp. TaxID=1912891 RepID=UPI003B3A87B9